MSRPHSKTGSRRGEVLDEAAEGRRDVDGRSAALCREGRRRRGDQRHGDFGAMRPPTRTACPRYVVSVAIDRPASAGRAGVCRSAGGVWRTKLASREATAGDGFATASGESLAERRLADLRGSGPLTGADEKGALAGR